MPLRFRIGLREGVERGARAEPLGGLRPGQPGPLESEVQGMAPGLARQRVNQWFREQGIRPDIYAQVTGNEAIVSMVSLGFGVGVVPELVVENSPKQANVSILPVQPSLKPFTIGICSLRRKLSNPLIRAFWELARDREPAALSTETRGTGARSAA